MAAAKMSPVPFRNCEHLFYLPLTHSLSDRLVFFFTMGMHFVLRTSIMWKGFEQEMKSSLHLF